MVEQCLAEVCDFGLSIRRNEDVLGLQVPVDYLISMQVIEALDDVDEPLSHCLLLVELQVLVLGAEEFVVFIIPLKHWTIRSEVNYHV